MKQLVNSAKKKNIEKERTAVLRLELDYELATLFDAISSENDALKASTTQKLEKIRHELLKLKAL